MAKSLVLAALLGLTLAAPAAAAAPSSLHLIAHVSQGQTLDVRTALYGDAQIGSGTLLDSRRHPVGSFSFTCVAVGLHPHYLLEQCSGAGSLGGGQLILAGLSRSDANDQRWAVIGGTGTYAGARGEARLHGLGPRETEVDLVLEP
jgi:hypothetical protein